MINIKKKLYLIYIFLLSVAGIFLCLNWFYPLSIPGTDGKKAKFAVTVVSESLTPLRSFPDENGVWRYPASIENVSHLYIEALLNYEDRWFYYHPGVNPLSLFRALYQYVKYGEIVTGGSTITMQVARIFHPHKRTFFGKIKQILRAFQLEINFSKNEILNFYLNFAPFGGTLEGVQTASYAYLGKSVLELSHAEAALLAVLPQAPSRMRPDRHPDRARAGRDKVLDRLQTFNVWDAKTVSDAKMEMVLSCNLARPMKTPLLARRLKNNAIPSLPLIKTGINNRIQENIVSIVRDYISTSVSRTSAAIIVVDNKTLLVKGYVGSADFFDNDRFGHVDMVQAVRSPGSTLKPFLYGFALEEGLIHSESLLVDAPLSFKGYMPGNFGTLFSGPVSVTEALQRSLNVSAVDILDRLTPNFFYSRLRQGGFALKLPIGAKPNLSMILGGVGSKLEDIVSAYTAFARNGMAGKLRFTLDDPIKEYPMMDPGAAWIIRKILREHRRFDLPWGGRLKLDSYRKVAWKTGTSYGFRDAWAIGVVDKFTVGVWTGRPDGTSIPGQYGSATAAPLLFRIIDTLPYKSGSSFKMPQSVKRVEICWPLGIAPTGKDDPLCHFRRTAWILNGVIPPTFPDRNAPPWQINPIKIQVNLNNGLRLSKECAVYLNSHYENFTDITQNKNLDNIVSNGSSSTNIMEKQIALWPQSAMPWLSARVKKLGTIPKFDPVCNINFSQNTAGLKITGIASDSIFRSPGNSKKPVEITLTAQGGTGRLYWLINDKLVAQAKIGEVRTYGFKKSGRYKLTVLDQAGNYDQIELIVYI